MPETIEAPPSESGPPSLSVQEDQPRILVAEDDEEMRRLVAEALRDDGYEVIEAANSLDLFFHLCDVRFSRRLGRDAIDLILTDYLIPGYSGLEVIQILREARCETPVILMTGFDDHDTLTRAHRLGAVMLQKPFQLDILRSVVRSCLR